MIKQLLGIRLRGLLSSLSGKNKKGGGGVSKGKIILFSLLYLYLGGVFALISGMNAYGIASVVLGTPNEWVFFSLFLLLPFAVVLFFSIFEMKAEIFEGKDNAILLSLPIPAKTIVLSRILTVLIFNFIECAIVTVPAWIVYLSMGGNPLSALAGFVLSVFVTLLATALSSAVGYAIAWISGRVKNKNAVTLVVSLVFLGLYFFLYGKMMTTDADITAVLVSAIPAVESVSLLVYVGSAATNAVAFLAVCGVSLAAFALSYYLISMNFLRLVTRQKSAKMTYKAKKEKQNTPFLSLSRKEFARFSSSANYILNGGMGFLLSVAFAVMMVVKRGNIGNLSASLGVSGGMYPLLITVAIAIASIAPLSYCSLSLEGKSLWLVRTLPVSAKTVLFAKAVPHFVCAAVSSLLSALILAVAAKPVGAEWLFVVLLPLVSSFAASVLGVVINTAFPKFDFQNELQVIKQSLSTLVGTFGPFLFVLAVLLLTFVFTMLGLGWLGLLVSTFLFAVLGAVAAVLLAGPCARKFDKLS